MSSILAPGGWSIRSIIRTLIIGWILMTVLTYLAGTSYRGIMILGAVAGWLGTVGYGYVLLQRSARRPGFVPPLALIPEAPPQPGTSLVQRTFGPKSGKLTQDEVEQARHNLLLGGVLEVVSQARLGGEKVEAWRAAGRRFRGVRVVGSGRARRKGGGVAPATASAETGTGLTDAPNALKGEA